MLYINISNRNICKCKGNIFKHVTVTCCILTFQILTFINVKVTFLACYSDMLYINISNRNIYKCKGNILKYVTVTQCRNDETTIDRG